jgi:hypothetical protein
MGEITPTSRVLIKWSETIQKCLKLFVWNYFVWNYMKMSETNKKYLKLICLKLEVVWNSETYMTMTMHDVNSTCPQNKLHHEHALCMIYIINTAIWMRWWSEFSLARCTKCSCLVSRVLSFSLLEPRDYPLLLHALCSTIIEVFALLKHKFI